MFNKELLLSSIQSRPYHIECYAMIGDGEYSGGLLLPPSEDGANACWMFDGIEYQFYGIEIPIGSNKTNMYLQNHGEEHLLRKSIRVTFYNSTKSEVFVFNANRNDYTASIPGNPFGLGNFGGTVKLVFDPPPNHYKTMW